MHTSIFPTFIHKMNLGVWSAAILCFLLTLAGIEPVHGQSSVTAPLNNATSLPVGSCTATIPCSNGACCNGNSGFCGFGPPYCTPVASGGNCTSNCDAQAECGQYAPPANLTCPLNVCCSQYGFCGTTTDFCGTGCQSNCGNPVVPSCGAETNSALTRRIGYYNGAAAYRSCMAFPPEQIYTQDLTHVNFAFAAISDTFQLVEANPGDSQLWQRTTNLKSQDPTLKIFISVGGWNFNDPPTSTIFSQLVASAANTNTFIASLLSVMETYGFDGLDVDWEYPGAYDRGGGPADTENYVTFMAAVKGAFSSAGYGLSFTAPSSYWYLQHFDLPGLLKSADWVNVMTYDLHGVWDGTDPYIGYVLDAHTNLTEIDQALDLYWRARVNPSQVTMGFAFYGRSFTLASSACWDPGCAWVSGGNPGPCSATAGILMFSEIENVLNQSSDAQSVTDPVAAVNYMIWNTNQWISYDNAETFGMKMNYANDHCLGGSMVWSLDQDDSNYDALSGLYGNVTQGIASGVTQSTGCIETDWNVESCPDGYSFVGADQNLDGESRFICCESGNAPSPWSCTWGITSVGSTCVPVCPPGDILLATSTSFCLSGAMPFCCATNVTAIDNCVTGDCSSSPTCPAGNASLFVTTVINGGASNSSSSTCTGGESKAFCCESDFPYQNCSWTGTPPLCLDTGCAVGQVQLLSDPQGDASQPCSGTGTRSYCCDPIGSAYVPVPFYDVFPSNVTEGAETFDVEFDPDVTNSPQADTLSNSTTTDNEETEAFGEVFIDSPNPQSVSSLAVVSDWVVTSCNAKSDQPQTVLAYCSKSMDNSGCAHVFIGGAEHTIVQMPRSCGLGPYARVASLVPHANQSILTAYHQTQKPANELVYFLSFDYDFSVIPASNGPIYMRADVTDMPGYWDSVVDSPPERKRWLQEQEMKKPILRRWSIKYIVGAIVNALQVEKSGVIARTFSWQDQWTIYQNSIACPGSSTQPSFEASLDITLSGMASASARFGFYLQATIVPPSVQAAYLFLNTDANAYAEFTIQGLALVQYNSQNIQFASFGFPGLYYPGLLTIGPSLVVNGYLAGEISVDATLSLVTQVQFPSINIQLGAVGDNFTGTPTDVISWPVGVPTPQFGVNVALDGDLSLHLVPALQLGINILNGALVDAQAYVQSDLYAGVSLSGSASLSQTPEVCYGAYFGVNFYGGLTGSLLFWEGASVSWPFYQNEIPLAQQCMTLGSSSTKRDISNASLPMLLDAPLVQRAPDSSSPAYLLERIGDKERYIYPVSQQLTIEPIADESDRITKRDSSAAVPTVPGTMLCPGPQGVNETDQDGDVYSDLPTNLLDAMERKRRSIEEIPIVEDYLSYLIFDDDDQGNTIGRRSVIQPEELARTVNIPNCANLQFTALAYDNAATDEYWDLEWADILNPLYATGTRSPYATANTYAREHIYEIQLVAQFIAELYSLTFWQANGTPNTQTAFCNWVSTNVLQSPIQNQLATCLPNNPLGVTNGPYMPWLEAWANSVKARAFSPMNIFTQTTFNNYTASKKVAVMRATSGLTVYMNDPKVRESFISSSDCIRDVWGGADTTGTIVPLYDSWVVGKLNTFNTQIQTGMNNMIQWWNTAAGAATTLVPVVLDYSNFVSRNPTAFNYDTSGQELQTDIIGFATGNGINWINQL